MNYNRFYVFDKKDTFFKFFYVQWRFRKYMESMTSVLKFDTIHIVYDNYIGDSIKETFKESDPLEYIDLFLQSPLPVQLDWFWGCSRNKEKIQAWSRSFFSDKSKLSNKTIILNGYTSNSGESFSADKYIEGSNNILTELEFPIGEADLRIKPQV